jgi:hypothetical protein
MTTATSYLVLNLVKEFTDTPGPRYRTEGDFSGEQFREDLLLPRFRTAMEKRQILFVDLDGAQGYATSFLEEAFGGLARIVGSEKVMQYLKVKSEDEPYLEEEVMNYVRDSKK